mmetsp:Transcript_97364/g.231659  ORF Transcript_97364/g.231659 Transcript_97364/m.231659 type:complete len:481 (-) Transcript_97364:47-1489(-)
MNSSSRELLGALQRRADLAAVKKLITPETAKTRDIFYNLQPLFWALSYGAGADVLTALLDAHPPAATEKHPEGWTPLHYAEKLDAAAVKLLLARCPGAAAEVDKEGDLPLHWAAEHNAPKEVVKLLLEAYPEGALCRDKRGRLPAQLALEQKVSEEVLQLLRAASPGALAPPVNQEFEPVGVIFPGWGSEYVGMLKGIQHLPEVQAMLAEAQSVLGYDLLKVCLNGPLQEQTSAAALFVGSLAAMKSEEKLQAGHFKVLAGMFVGEYAALTAAGVFSMADGLALVLECTKALESAAKSREQASLCVVGLEELKVLELCRKAVQQTGPEEVCEISGYLHNRSFTVAGTAEAVSAFQSLAKSAKAMQLEQLKGGASHTKLMQPAVQQLQAKLRALLPRMSRPRCSVVMNATGRAIDWTTEPEVVIQLLCEQMIMPVRWKESMKTMGKMELDVIYECGPKKQLKALMRRIDSDLWARTVNVEV